MIGVLERQRDVLFSDEERPAGRGDQPKRLPLAELDEHCGSGVADFEGYKALDLEGPGERTLSGQGQVEGLPDGRSIVAPAVSDGHPAQDFLSQLIALLAIGQDHYAVAC